MIPEMPANVAAVFASYPPAIAAKLAQVRQLIFATATSLEGVGPLTETLKWGEPAYLTEQSKSGSTIRVGLVPRRPDLCAVYFNCNTSLLDTFRTLFADELTLAGDRAIVLDTDSELPQEPLAACISMALTYHLSKPRRGQAGGASLHPRNGEM